MFVFFLCTVCAVYACKAVCVFVCLCLPGCGHRYMYRSGPGIAICGLIEYDPSKCTSTETQCVTTAVGVHR